ncbi:MAG: 2-hydroxyacyl-CoA dehydratase family protein [Proteobacteria bacterium]|nr:2-hydroxyacyl-CoA dehydratase family protein [Pseudomonadota bacterium]
MKLFAYYDTGHEFSEEIIMAAGFTPYKILGDVHVSNDPADRYVHHYICPFSRSCLTEGMARSKDWVGIAFCHGCDTTNNQYDIWKYHVKTDFLYWINTPAKNDLAANTFHEKELRRFITHLENHFSVEITQDKLSHAIQTSNRVKHLMRELAALRSVKDIPNSAYHALTRKCVQMNKEELVELLEDKLKEWKNLPVFPADREPVLLTGSDITYGEVMEILETAGLRAVRDDLSLGERYFAQDISQEGDPVKALVDYHTRIPQPPTKIPFDARLSYLESCLKETPVSGIVYQILKFCEPHGLDLPFMTGELKRLGHTLIVIEREYTPTVDQQLVSRLESFREIIQRSL